MGSLGGDCPGVARGGPPTRARGQGTPREARQPLLWRDPPFGCQPEGGQERDGRVGRVRGAGGGGPTPPQGVGRRDPGLTGTATYAPIPGHVVPVQENRGGGHSAAGTGSRQRSSPFLQWASPTGGPFPSLGWEARGSTPGMGWGIGWVAERCPWHRVAPQTPLPTRRQGSVG